jgi:protein-S-isoprenylcysteine O-methyltransferase Ste14
MKQGSVIRRLVQVFLILVLQGALLFVSAGTLAWTWAWIFLSAGILILLVNLLVLPREVIEERGSRQKNVKQWDRSLSLWNTVAVVVLYVFIGLDHRLSWSMDIAAWIHIAALVLYVSGAMLFTWSMVSNKFFSTFVRIQSEREHAVQTGGPYRYVRHPGYVGFILMYLVTPITMGSLYGLVISLVISLLVILRTVLEDRTLMLELEGYEAYAEGVRYRLLPRVW